MKRDSYSLRLVRYWTLTSSLTIVAIFLYGKGIYYYKFVIMTMLIWIAYDKRGKMQGIINHFMVTFLMFSDLMSRITDLFDLLLRLDFSRKVLSTLESPFSIKLFFCVALRSLSFMFRIY